ncbi:MAG: hypothetical protein QOF15_334 [Mycobacterium sp.]|jgi:hypothetical protein|nr:hypothetical protein [Mycobacterium sp.]
MNERPRISEQTQIAGIERRLIQQFPDVVPDHVDAVVRQEHARFEASPIRDFIPLLVEKRVRQQLTR